MKELVIIGAGGMGRTFYDMARESLGFGETFVIKGFIDDNLDALKEYENYPPVLARIQGYEPQPDEVFTCSIGGVSRRKCIEEVVAKGGEFINLINKYSRIGSNVKIGKGNVIGAFTTLGADCQVGDYNLIQSYTVIGHDAEIGDWNRIDTHVTCVGGIRVHNEADIYTGAVISHNVVVEDKAHVAANSFVIRKVKSGTTVIGVPAKVLKI